MDGTRKRFGGKKVQAVIKVNSVRKVRKAIINSWKNKTTRKSGYE